MKKAALTLLLILPFVMACAQLHPFHWLEGTWKLENKNVFEVWRMDGDVLKGISYKVSGSDTTILEKISLIKHGEKYLYVPDVPENEGAVEFQITTMRKDGFIAENTAHDFPKIIRYTIVRKRDKEFISASIEGNGKIIPYTFEKMH